MAQHNYLPGIPVDYHLNLPVATVAQIAIPGRAPVNGTPASVFTGNSDGSGKAYRWNGVQ